MTQMYIERDGAAGGLLLVTLTCRDPDLQGLDVSAACHVPGFS